MLQVYQVLFLCPKKGKPGSFSPKKATRVGTSSPKLAMGLSFCFRTIFIIVSCSKHRRKQSPLQSACIDKKAARTVWCGAFKSTVCLQRSAPCGHSTEQQNKQSKQSKQSKHTTLDIDIDIDRHNSHTPYVHTDLIPCYFTTFYPAHTL